MVVLAAVDLYRIRHELSVGQDELRSLDFATVEHHGGLVPTVRVAAGHLAAADHLARTSPWLGVLSHVPGLGSQIDAVRDLTGATHEIGNDGLGTAQRVQQAMDTASSAGAAGRLPLVDAVHAAVDDLRTQLAQVDVGARGTLVWPVSSARRQLVRRLQKADVDLARADEIVGSLRSFLAGPRRYVILGGNNAEMRAAGIATTSGVATIDGGRVEVGPFVDSDPTRLPKGQGVSLPDGWKNMYGFLDVDREMGNDVISPNFPLAGRTAAGIAARGPDGSVDGVIYVDTITLQVLLQAVGPVTVDGVTYNGTNAAQILINQNYLDNAGSFTSADQAARRDAQGRVARAVFDALDTRSIPLLTLASKLQTLAATRHLMAYSVRPDEQRMWEEIGADGSVDPQSLDVTLQNLSAGKVDWYVNPTVGVAVNRGGDGGRRVDLDITVPNPPRNPTSEYIEGGHNIYADPGQYGAFLVVFLPRDAYDIVNQDPGFTNSDFDGDLRVVSMTYRVELGATRTVHLSFRLPGTTDHLQVVPSGRAHPVKWTWDRKTFSDIFPFRLDLSSVPITDPPGPGWMLTGLVLFAAGLFFAGEGLGEAAVATDPRRRRLGRADFATGVTLLAGALLCVAAQVLFLALA